MRKEFENILKILGISFIVVTVWQVLELIVYGETIPNRVDSIIGMILTYSLYLNLKHLELVEYNKKNKSEGAK